MFAIGGDQMKHLLTYVHQRQKVAREANSEIITKYWQNDNRKLITLYKRSSYDIPHSLSCPVPVCLCSKACQCILGIILVFAIGYRPTSEVLLGVIQGAVGLCPDHVSHVSLVFQVLDFVEHILQRLAALHLPANIEAPR